jgi:hypothetical protein
MFYSKLFSYIVIIFSIFFYYFADVLVGFFLLFSDENLDSDFNFYTSAWLTILRTAVWSSNGVIFYNTYEEDYWYLLKFWEFQEGISGAFVGIHLFFEILFLTFFLFYFTSVYRKKKKLNFILNINNIELILFIYFISFLIIFFIVFIPIFIKFFFLNNFVYYTKGSLFFFLFIYLSSYVYLVWFTNSLTNRIVHKFCL